MRYRIWTDGERYKIQRKRLFGWVWLDNCNEWDNGWGKEHPQIFYSEESVVDYIKKRHPEWRVKKELTAVLIVGGTEKKEEVSQMAAGARRAGKPRSQKERAARHKRLHPGTKMPKRGSGLRGK